jgi:prophage regulatory protein
MTGSDDPIIRGWKKIEKVVHKSRSQLWRDVRAGRFPAPLDLGPNSVGWLWADIDDWIASRPRRQYGASAASRAEPQQRTHTISAPPLPRRRGRLRKDAKRSTDDSTDSLTMPNAVAGEHRIVRVQQWMHRTEECFGLIRNAA